MLSQNTWETIYVFGVLVFLLTEHKWKIWSGEMRFGAYGFYGMALLIGWIDILLKTPISPNIIESRMFSNPTAAHQLIWMGVFTMGTIAGLYPKLNPVLAAKMIGLMISLHELYWYGAYFINNGTVGISGIMWRASPYVLLLSALLMFAIIDSPFTTRQLSAILMALTTIYAIWLAIGFPITTNFHGPTPLLHDFFTNAYEDFSWLLPTAIATIFGVTNAIKSSKILRK